MDDLTRYLTSADVAPVDPRAARSAWHDYRLAHGRKTYQSMLSAPSDILKFHKGLKVGIVNYGLALAPAETSGHNACRYSTAECRQICVATSGMGRYESVGAGRILRTRFLREDPSAFCTLVASELTAHRDRYGDALRVRLNTYSDIPWERAVPWLLLDGVAFYDYTKWPRTRRSSSDRYRLTYSVSELTKLATIRANHAAGENSAVVFDVGRTRELPECWEGLRVIDGDTHDDRYSDPRPVIVGLRAKGRAMGRETLGMVKSPVAFSGACA